MAKHDPIADAKRRSKAKNARRKNNPKSKPKPKPINKKLAVGRGKQRKRTKKT